MKNLKASIFFSDRRQAVTKAVPVPMAASPPSRSRSTGRRVAFASKAVKQEPAAKKTVKKATTKRGRSAVSQAPAAKRKRAASRSVSRPRVTRKKKPAAKGRKGRKA